MTGYALYEGDCLDILPTLEAGSVHWCVTSPPYYGLRDYGHDGQIGLEETPEAYVEKMVQVFREVRRVLRDDGTVWLNLGDSYASSGPKSNNNGLGGSTLTTGTTMPRREEVERLKGKSLPGSIPDGLKPKDLIGIPWRVALALQADGWWLRQDIIWHKPNPMPESVTDRCTKAHEYIFLLSKSARYYYDAEAVKEESLDPESYRPRGKRNADGKMYPTRNRRSVWTVTTQPFKGAHFATFPPKLIEPCVLAGCPVGGTVLDPFNGAGTTGLVALQNGRRYVGVELNPDYLEMARQRIDTYATTKPVILAGEPGEVNGLPMFAGHGLT